MNTRHVLTLVLVCFVAACSGQDTGQTERFVPVPATIENDGVPPIPMEIMDTMQRYADVKSASFGSWAPSAEGMLVVTRLGNTSQIYEVRGAERRPPAADGLRGAGEPGGCVSRSREETTSSSSRMWAAQRTTSSSGTTWRPARR